MSDSSTPPPAPEPRALPPKRDGHGFMLFFSIIGVIAVLIALGGVGFLVYKDRSTQNAEDARQAQLQPFYTPPASIPSKPGSIIRMEPLGANPEGGTGYRILYTSTDFQGHPAAVSGMIWVSNQPAPAGGRPVIAWAHGTVGQADKCAPSRANNVLADTNDWLDVAMQRGYVVTATDYLGLGTPGPKSYLIGQQEAADVVNSVRAVHELPNLQAGNRWVVWGHSQGGNSSLWTGALAQKLMPEYKLIGVGAAAPATELTVIMQQQWKGTIGWVIGPEALISFKDRYPDRDFDSILSNSANGDLQYLQTHCTTGGALDGLVHNQLSQPFFKSSPIDSPAWAQTALENTPPVLPKSMPLFMSEGTADTIVLSGSNALMQEQWCEAGSSMTAEWLGGVGHLQVAIASGPAFMQWTVDRFAGKPQNVNCSFPPASPALPPVTVPPEVLAAPPTQGTSNTTADADPPPSPSVSPETPSPAPSN